MIDIYRLIECARSRVRAQPNARISLEAAAEDAGLSAVRFHQLFYEVQGENYGAFVRRVRLEYAVGLMRAFPERTCTMIAHDTGFSESSDFTRSFKRAYGLAPSRWDRLTPLARLACKHESSSGAHPPQALYPDQPIHADSPVTVREIQARRVAVLHVPHADDPEQLAAAFDRLEQWIAERGELKEGRHFIGLSDDSDLDTPVDTYRFELAYEVGPAVRASGEVMIRDLPACRAAVLPCRGGEQEFVAAWDHLQRGFLPNTRWAPGLAPQMEIYHCDPRKTKMIYWDMDCVLPVTNEGELYE